MKGSLEWVSPETKQVFFLSRAKSAYWTPYLAKMRGQMSGGATFSLVMFGLIPQVINVQGPTLLITLLFSLGTITAISLFHDLRWKIPSYCWIVAVYGLMVEAKSKDEIRWLDGVTKHMLDSNWDEASWWLAYELKHKANVEKPSKPGSKQ